MPAKNNIAAKIKFLREHENLARVAFVESKDTTPWHNTDAATELIRFARRKCGYSKSTAKVDIFASLKRAWDEMGEPG